jgi:hypothetical protein
MQLNSSDAATVELRIAGYQYPDYYQGPPLALEAVQRLMGRANIPVVVDKWDLNWLQVCGNITPSDGKAWAFEQPCLTTWEAREFGDWLREVAAGTVPPSPSGSEPGGWVDFTEPNLSFNLADRTGDRVRMRAYFTAEATPPRFQRGQGRYPNTYLVPLDVSADEVAKAAESWMRDLAEFPER